ncbi:hypothetical protein ACP70R_032734 [Stipagrostis hirtigluma subsp. patula]
MDPSNPGRSASGQSPPEKKRGREEFLAAVRSGGAAGNAGAVRDLHPMLLEGAGNLSAAPPRKKTKEELFTAIFEREFCLGTEVDVVDIEIPLKHIFAVVMERLGARPPTFSFSASTDELIKLTVDFEVPAKYCNGNVAVSRRIEGDATAARENAEHSALMRCFECLAKKHHVLVVDFSSRQAEHQHNKCHDIHPRAKEVCNYQISRNHLYGVLSEAGKVYSDAEAFMASIAKDGYEDLNGIREEQRALDGKRQEFLQYVKSSVQAMYGRGPTHDIGFTEKDVLAYVMEIMKRPLPDYMSKPYTQRSMFHGYVTVDLPFVPNVPCVGRVQFDGKAIKETSGRAEEQAAAKAICYIEKKYHVNVKDLNYQKRVAAKGRYKDLAGLEFRFFQLGEKIKHRWALMNKGLDMARDLFGYVPDHVSAGKKKALHFCSPDVKKIYEDSVEEHKVAMSKIQQLKN